MSNLKDRLNRIREINKSGGREKPKIAPRLSANISLKGWETCGFKTLKRDLSVDFPYKLTAPLPPALAIVVPDLAMREIPAIEDFLFFDLETTGLSGGAGTLAFLAAFGRIIQGGKLHITQYLLLDYPGESDFLDAVLKEFKNESSIITTYNGKCFDSQILKTRCLMNGIKPPEYAHADLLHPARRLWKNIIGDCSQGSIETRILGLDRTGDIPGALAPEIWFDFLRTGRTERLEGICDHNCADISGLASVLAAMITVAKDPMKEAFQFDTERLALYWRGFTKRNDNEDLRKTGVEFLKYAADFYPRAAFVYALDAIKSGNFNEGRLWLLKLACSTFSENIRAAALRSLAIDSEKRLKQPQEALEFVNKGMKLLPESNPLYKEFEKRKERLEKKAVCLVNKSLT